MARRHFDVIILGESLASRIAGVMLARAGLRVLLAGSPEAAPPTGAWIPLSQHLERLIETLGGRSCIAPSTPFQVLSGPVRLTLHGFSPLLDELRRELPTDAQMVASLLGELEETGNRLETALWECGGLPLTGPASRLRFLRARLRRGLARAGLRLSLCSRLPESGSAAASQALSALFAGLSLTSAERLSVAEASLLWRGFGADRGISVRALDELLSHRFGQYHGEQAELSHLQVPSSGEGVTEVTLKDGRTCSADFYLLGAPDLAAFQEKAPAAAPVSPRAREELALVEGEISPLLTPGLILDGTPPLRLTLLPAPDGSGCRICCEQPASSQVLSSEEVMGRIAFVFPFTTWRIGHEADPLQPFPPPADGARRPGGFPGLASTFAVQRNLLHCCGAKVLPSLGAIGDVLLGVCAANHIQRQKRS